MKIDVTKAIIDYLHTQKEVSIPGVGSFQARIPKANLSLGHEIVEAPATELIFTDEVNDEDSFVKYIQDEYKLSFAKADNLLKNFATSVINKLLNLGSASIPGIGELVQKPEVGLIFNPEKYGFDKQNYGLLPLDISPVVRSGVEKKETVHNILEAKTPLVPKLVTERKGNWWGEIWPSLILILILSALLFVLATWLNGPKGMISDINKSTQSNTEKSLSERPVTEEEIIDFFESENNFSDQNIIESVIDSGSQTSDEEESLLKDNSVGQEEGSGLSRSESLAANKSKERNIEPSGEPNMRNDEEEAPKSNKDRLEDGESSLPAKDKKSHTKIIEEERVDDFKSKSQIDSATFEHLSDHPKLVKYKDILSWDALETGCVIIVGSFKNNKNAIKMQNRIINANLQPFTSYTDGYTRVGIIFDCKDHDLEGYIDTIRNNFHPQAWYLVPELEVTRKLSFK